MWGPTLKFLNWVPGGGLKNLLLNQLPGEAGAGAESQEWAAGFPRGFTIIHFFGRALRHVGS